MVFRLFSNFGKFGTETSLPKHRKPNNFGQNRIISAENLIFWRLPYRFFFPQVIDDPTKVFKIIKETEAEEGLDGKMDKKSLQRILTRLATEGQVRTA